MKNKTIFISLFVALTVFSIKVALYLVCGESLHTLTEEKLSMSILLLLASFLTTHVIQISLKLSDVDEKITKHNDLLQGHPGRHDQLYKEVVRATSFLSSQENAIKSGNHSFDIFWALCMIRAKEGIYDLIDSQTFEVKQQHIPAFWMQAILNTDNSWLCTTYVNTEYNWEEGWTKRGIECQRISIDNNASTVKRIFIFSKEEDKNLPKWQNIMAQQKKYGIRVKSLIESNSLDWESLSQLRNRLDSIDIALVDGKYLLCFHQNKDKRIDKIFCTTNPDITKVASLNYNSLWDASKEVG